MVIGILEDYRGRGLGGRFLLELDLWAKENTIIIEIYVIIIKN